MPQKLDELVRRKQQKIPPPKSLDNTLQNQDREEQDHWTGPSR